MNQKMSLDLPENLVLEMLKEELNFYFFFTSLSIFLLVPSIHPVFLLQVSHLNGYSCRITDKKKFNWFQSK